MTINLKPFQQKAVDELIGGVAYLLSKDGQQKVCVFQAPTGSGKTVMTAKFIEGLIRERAEEDVCFVWVTIGKGDLHLQSRHDLERIFNGSPRVVLVEEEFSGGREHIIRNEVVVANWEKLRNKDRATGEWKNLLMKEGEKLNFRDVLDKTREERRIILIIDESHIGATAERTNELRREINADVVLEMSATPKIQPDAKDIAQGNAKYVYVDPSVVIEEGMIKKDVVINEGIGEIVTDEDDSQTIVLEAAYQKRSELKALYEKEKVRINPLVLIQIPSAEAGEAKIEAIKIFLSKKGITEKNGKLAIWLAEQKSETIDWIREPDNEIEFLIFKQAIDTGWDCTRAHILVKFRESHSETFEIQTVGRILRMPEQKHYASEDLNRAFLYTNVQSILVKREEYNLNIIKHIKSTRMPEYTSIALRSYYKARADYGDVTSSFLPVFDRVACEHLGITGDAVFFAQNEDVLRKQGINLERMRYEQEIIADTKIDAKSFDELLGKIVPDALARLALAGNDLQALFEQIIRSHLGSFTNVRRSVPAVKTAVYQWFRKYLGSEEWSEEILLVQKMFVHNGNRKVFETILSKAIEAYRVVKEQEVRKRVAESEQYYIFEIPQEMFFNEYTDERRDDAKKYAHHPCYLATGRSIPEQHFEEFLNENTDKISWWWKNGENKQTYFGIKYEYEGGFYTFYPDYLVQHADGRLGIFEVKEAGDRDGTTYTKVKAEALQKYIVDQKNKNIFGGIVIERNSGWYVNDKAAYDWEKCERGDWSEWKDMNF